MSETKFAAGFFFDKPREGAPDFVRGRISIKAEEAIKMINDEKNEAGYVNLDLLRSKDGTKMYLTVDDWKPEPKGSPENSTDAPQASTNTEGEVEQPW